MSGERLHDEVNPGADSGPVQENALQGAPERTSQSASALLARLMDGHFDAVFSRLYPGALPTEEGLLELHRRRFEQLVLSLPPEREHRPVHLFSVPGRTELAGNHTDHNLGKVLAASVHLDLAAAVLPADNLRVSILSEGYPGFELDLSDCSPRPEEREQTAALVRGVADWYRQKGLKIGGFTAVMHGMVPSGSGLSSSAAFEIMTAKILSSLYNDDGVSVVDMALAGQYAENSHFGKPCGLMDQIACAHGGAVAIDFSEPGRPRVRGMEADFLRAGYFLGIVNSGGSHADLTREYAAVPAEMKQVAAYFSASHLRQLDEARFFAALPELRGSMSHRALLRAMHFFAENRRVDAMADALSRGSIKEYLRLAGESGSSSMRFLQNVIPPGKTVEQNLALVQGLFESRYADAGVMRVHGGGFEGSLQFYIDAEHAADLVAELQALCGQDSVEILHIRQPGALCLTLS